MRISPRRSAFGPELILVSAGFDAHRRDPLANCRLETADFAAMACHVRDFATRLGAPLGAVLEGGYEPAVLAECTLATLTALSGEGEAIAAAPEPLLTPHAAAQFERYWPL